MSDNRALATLSNDFFDAFVAAPAKASPPSATAPIAIMRVFDVFLASVLILFFAPLMVFIAVLTFVTDPGPIVFAHRRIGRNGASLACLKFRSMAVDAQERLAHLLATDPQARMEWDRDHKLSNDPRITAFGRFLRRSSLDELPQLFNVVRGEMSLVGPRPITADEACRYGRYIADYYKAVPGITGLWQISGRSETTYRRRVALDVMYVRRQSPSLYLSILARTLPAVLLARGSR